MTSYPMEKEEEAARLIELVKKTIASLPQPHDVRTREHHEQCDECSEWRRAVENSFEKIEGEEGMMSGELGMLMFMALTEQASDLATLTGSPPYSRSLSPAALERLSDGSPEGLVKELALSLEWAARTKAAMLAVSNVLEKAINDVELEIPEHRQRTNPGACLGFGLFFRITIALLLIAPLGFVLGMPFPLGLQVTMQRSSALGAWAWGVNGFFTVIGTVLALMLGMMVGFRTVLLLACGCYLVGLLVIRRISGRADGAGAKLSEPAFAD